MKTNRIVKYYFLLLAILSACSLSVAIEESDTQSNTPNTSKDVKVDS